jgi:hypothetical protein
MWPERQDERSKPVQGTPPHEEDGKEKQGGDGDQAHDVSPLLSGMRKFIGLGVASAVILLELIANTTPGLAKPEYTRRTRKDCPYCHVPPGYSLNDAGRYYRDHKHSLDGFAPVKPKAAHSLQTR